MRSKKKDRKAKIASNKVLLASVTEEMAQPRVAQSARAAADEQSNQSYGKLTRHHSEGGAEAHTEQYGTGTPPVKKGP